MSDTILIWNIVKKDGRLFVGKFFEFTLRNLYGGLKA